MNKQKIYFRADAGAGIGYGHFIRSLALADMLKSDFDCVMFTQESTPYQISEAGKVCQLVSLPADESKFEKFLSYLTGDEIVVLDNYFYTTEYQQQIKNKGCKLVCIDDMHDKHFVADVVINHGIVSKESYDVESYTRVYTSPKYALLRKPFLTKQPIAKREESWVVTIGGLDEPNITTMAVRQLQAIGISDITAIVGDGFKHRAVLETTGVKILSQLTAQQMAETLAQTENVLCCASTVCYEALSQGCHVYAGWYVDNQVEIYNLLAKSNYIEPLGNLLSLRSIERKPTNTLAKIDFDRVRPNIRSVFYCLALRMVNYIDMTKSESRQVWKTRNLLEIRQWMRNKNPFSFESHCAFVESLQSAKDKLYCAFFIGNQLVGSYDFIHIIDGDSAECGIFLHPKWQGKGMSLIIESVMEKEIKKRGVLRITSDVYKNNIKSSFFLGGGSYHILSQDDEFIYFEKNL